MLWFKNKCKGAEICAALIDVLTKLDKDIEAWDGKLCNKKFYLFLRENVKGYAKEHGKIINHKFYTNNFWLEKRGGACFWFDIIDDYDASHGGINCYIIDIFLLSDIQRAKINPRERGRVSYSKFHSLLDYHIRILKESAAMC